MSVSSCPPAPRRLAVVPPPAHDRSGDAVARSADLGADGARPLPASLAQAVVEEIVEAAVTIGEDVEEIVEEAVGEVLAAGGRSLRALREAARRVDEGHPLDAAGDALAALRGEVVRTAGAVAGTSATAGRHAVGRAAVAVSRVATALLRPLG
ncbi:hypothetical protein [Actinomycetospora cinnamomea]|uniref:Uncharacterized protein n=1 Tax=Actinomycetospora cinnamomea TaxID=663609 RepID=A0A2U1FA66_9PSEU|nr:hypothetical protein [Actinomycetospora cinnamomea]PVZ09081.1 hypothetical protein C8D89_107245 [Actinomycetospora cinnamomea]